jgi:hypothetical protein
MRAEHNISRFSFRGINEVETRRTLSQVLFGKCGTVVALLEMLVSEYTRLDIIPFWIFVSWSENRKWLPHGDVGREKSDALEL